MDISWIIETDSEIITKPEDLWGCYPMIKCLNCGDVIQWREETSIVMCSCSRTAVDECRVVYWSRDTIIACLDPKALGDAPD